MISLGLLGFVIAASFGAVCRFWLERQSVHRFGQRVPWGTLAANVLGSAFLGWFAAGDFTALVTVMSASFAGAFTTFGGFIGQSYERFRHRQSRGLALTYLLATVTLSLAAAWLGLVLHS